MLGPVIGWPNMAGFCMVLTGADNPGCIMLGRPFMDCCIWGMAGGKLVGFGCAMAVGLYWTCCWGINPGPLLARLLKAGDVGGALTVLPGPIVVRVIGAGLCGSLRSSLLLTQPTEALRNKPAPRPSNRRFQP